MTRREPLSTYRLQLHPGFTFAHARAVCEYLAELGVTDIYVSPIPRAEKGSTHGYNVCAYDQLNPELGGDEGFVAFSDEARRRGLRLLVDFVPNHMGIATGENAWWNDVLENGPSSLFADFFDIDWDRAKASLHARVLYPILGAQYGEVLENGELVLAREGGTFSIRYFEHLLPVAPRSLLAVFELALEGLLDASRASSPSSPAPGPADADDPDVTELLSIVTATRNLPQREETAPERRTERAREKEVIKRRMGALTTGSARIAQALDGAVAKINGRKGEPKSFDRLDTLLREQSYRLSYWRVASEEINYRRFFDINQLGAVRMELPVVFEQAHARILALVREGRIDGLRLDHTDGLRDPAEYFSSLRRAAGERLYVVAEKILVRGERIPRAWEIDGTTGYDVVPLLSGVWIDGTAEAALTSLYRRITGDPLSFAAHAWDGKRTVIRGSFSPEVSTLALALERIAEGDRRSRDFTRVSLHEAIVETLAAFPVYRSYLRADGSRGPNDEQHVVRAIALARRRNPGLHASVFDFLRDVLLMKRAKQTEPAESDAEARTSFALSFQQLSGPIMAKGTEDTAYYRDTRFVALNEVGGDPGHFGAAAKELHEAAQARLRDWPLSMVASSTHDTKRGEDVRARLAVLTERPERWATCVDEWMRIAESTAASSTTRAPSEVDLYLFFQTVLGAWPFRGIDAERETYTRRLVAYMSKASREAKIHGSWIEPNQDYERALTELVQGLLGEESFVNGVRALADETATYAATNALASVALKLTGPGVPDTYQGSEMWNFSLVDPDNRSEVDYGARRAALKSIREASEGKSERSDLVRSLLARFPDGAIKLYVTHALLRLRRELGPLHLHGSYGALDGGEHVVAFTREHEGRMLACIVPRLAWKLGGISGGSHAWPMGAAWGERTLALPRKRWSNVLTGAKHAWAADAPMREVLSMLPIAVLVSE